MRHYHNKFIVAPICMVAFVAVASTVSRQRRIIEPSTLTLDSPMQKVNIPPTAPSGVFAYTLTNGISHDTSSHSPLRLVLWQTGKKASAAKPSTVFQFDSNFPNASPYRTLFSPNGQKVLVTVAAPTSFLDAYRFFFWDLKTKQLQHGPTVQYCPLAFWSQDGKNIAYFQGGDSAGEVPRGTQPPRLYLYNIQSGMSRYIVQCPEAGGISWTYQGALLYSFKPREKAEAYYTYYYKRPSIFEARRESGRSNEIIKDGYAPVPSPDGRWIAFLGWPDAVTEEEALREAKAKGEPSVSQFGLYLYDRIRKARTLVYPLNLSQRGTGGVGSGKNIAIWSPDSRHLFTVQEVYKDTRPSLIDTSDYTHYPGSGELHLRSLELPSLKQRQIGIITMRDRDAQFDPEDRIRLVGLSHNATHLFLYTSENRIQHEYDSLCAVNLQDGTTRMIFDGTDLFQVDWHEQSTK